MRSLFFIGCVVFWWGQIEQADSASPAKAAAQAPAQDPAAKDAEAKKADDKKADEARVDAAKKDGDKKSDQAKLEKKLTAAEIAALTRRLVLQLNHEELAKRDAAEKQLAELGPAILNHLPRTNSRTPAEVRLRLTRVIKSVESVAAKLAVNASKVTLQGKHSLKDVFAAIEKQTGNKATGYEEGTEIEIDLKGVSYWEAIDKILDEAGLSVSQFGQESNLLSLTTRPDEQTDRIGRAAYSGLFRLEAVRIQSVRDLLNPSVEGMRVTVNIGWEPRLSPISLSQPFAQVTATDEQEGTLSIDAEGRQDVPVQPGMSAVELDLPFDLPSRDVKTIKSLKGELIAMLPGRVERFEFKRLRNASNIDQRRAGVTVTLERVRKNQALYKIHVGVRFEDAANALESHRGWVYNNKAYVIDKAGEKIDSAGIETTRQGDNEVGVAYLFDIEKGIDGARFVYETPALIIRMPVKYELKNIELP